MAIKQVADYTADAPIEYIYSDGGYYPGPGWTFNEDAGTWVKPKPNPNTPSQFTLEDIKNRSGYAFDPLQDKLVTDSRDESLSPSAYYNQLAKDLSEASYGVWSINGDPSQYTNLIEGLKEVDPKAYYTAKIDTLSRGIGHQYQSNQGARGDVIKQQLEALIPEAQKAGVTPQEINSLYGSGYSAGAKGFSQILSGQQSQGGGTLAPLLEGLKVMAPAALIPLTAGASAPLSGALTGALGATAASIATPALIGASLGGISAALGGGNIGQGLLTGGITGAIGGGIGNAFGGGALSNVAGGTLAGGAGAAIRGGNVGQGALLGGFGGAINAGINSLTDSSTSLFNTDTPINVETTGTTKMDELYGPTYDELGYSPFVGPTYQELGYTGLGEGQMGPSYEELGFTGFNQDAAITAADAAAAAAQGISGSTLASLAKQFGSSAIKALIGGGTAAGASRVGGSLGGALGGLLGGGNTGLGNLLGGAAGVYLTDQQRQAIQNAYNQQSQRVGTAATTAAQQAAFTPVGMTTAFGSSNFQVDPATGRLVSAGYTPSAQVAGLQQSLFGQAANTAQQAGQVGQQTAPIAAGAQGMFNLGNQFLPTSAQTPQATAESQALYNRLNALSNQVLPTSYDTQAAAQRYMQQQQNLLNPGRAQTLAQLQSRQYGAGTSGLATGGTTAGYGANAQGLMATNPQMAAYYNAMAQQDAQLAANAEQQARTNLQSDINLGSNLGTTGLNALTTSQQQQYANMMNNLSAGQNLYKTGTGLLGAAQTLQTGAYDPLTAQMGLLRGLETSAQQPFAMSTDLAKAQAAAGANAGQLGLQGQIRAAELASTGALQSNAAMQGTYNQLGQVATGLGNQLGGFLSQNQTIQEWLK